LSNRGRLTAISSTISGNNIHYSRDGGGVYNNGTMTLTNSTISRNTASYAGGGVSNRGQLTATNSTISANAGGGVENLTGTMTLTNSTISGNSAEGLGSGVSNYGVLTLTNCTIFGNTASSGIRGRGGGVFNSRQLDLNRTLISGNTASGAGSEVYNYKYGSISAANFNLFGHSGLINARAFRNFTPRATDITATSNGNTPTKLSNILNTTLADNGGPTKTHSLAAGSPAVDAINNGTCPPPARDQRGVKRPQDGNSDGGIACDIGSFERKP
jgi:hypothetical protein